MDSTAKRHLDKKIDHRVTIACENIYLESQKWNEISRDLHKHDKKVLNFSG